MSRVVLLLTVLILGMAGACVSGSGEEDKIKIPSSPDVSEVKGSYEDAIYGFSIRYPREWSTQEGGPGIPAFTARSSGGSCAVQVFVETLSEALNLDDYSDSVIRSIKEKLTDYRVISEGKVELGTGIAYEYVFSGVEEGNAFESRLICVVRENRGYIVVAACEKGIYSLVEDTVENIVYSFRLQEPFSLADIDRDSTLVLYGTEPITMDPALVMDTESAAYVIEVFSGLVTLNRDLEVVPDIAETWDISEDGTVYTFRLRKDAEFHDGKSVTAHDFKYSIERACDPGLSSRTAADYLGDIVGVKEKLAGEANEVTGVRVLDEDTLQITIDAPKVHFISKLVYPTAYVVDEENVSKGEEWWRQPNGTGPFKIRGWKSQELLLLERNRGYYGQLPGVEKVVFRFWGGIPMTMYENGEIDITWVGGANLKRVLDPANPLNDELVTTPELSLTYIGFNSGKPPFDEAEVRQAFCHAVDKDKIVEALFEDMVEKADGILPPGMPGYNEQLRGLEFDPDKARDLISQSSYETADNLPSITYTTSGRGNLSPLTEALIDMWRENLGADIVVKQIDPERYAYEIKERKGDIFDIGWLADYPDPQNFLDILFHGQREDNIGEYSNVEVDNLLEKARVEVDLETRLGIYREVEELLVEDAACLPLYFGRNYILVKPYVKGFQGSPLLSPWLKYISIEPNG